MLFDCIRRVGWPLVPVLWVAVVATLLPPRVVRAEEGSAPSGVEGVEEPLGDEEYEEPSQDAAPEGRGRRPTGALANARADRDVAGDESVGSESEGGEESGDDEAAQLPDIDRDMDRTHAALPTGEDKSGVTSKTISMPQGAGKIDGMGESFSAQLSTGIATFGVPFALPGARGGAQPSLGLSYSSGGGNGSVGIGWSVGVPFIARQTDRGVPTYEDQSSWHPNQDRFVFNGGQELVPICTIGDEGACSPSGVVGSGALSDETFPGWAMGWQYFRPRVEGSFMRFFWSPDHQTWRVQDQSGVSLELGVPLDGSGYSAALDVNPDRPQEIYRWHLVRQYDTFGAANPAAGTVTPHNVVVYRYLQDGGMAYLSDIYDTTPASEPTNYSLGSFAHHTQLFYTSRPDPTVSYRSGWAIEQRLLLAQVAVSSHAFVPDEDRRLVRRYHLYYEEGSHHSLLNQVVVEGRCSGTEGSALTEPNGLVEGPECGTLPAMTFGYTHVEGYGTGGSPKAATLPGYEAIDERIRTITSSPPHSLDEQLTSLFDINSDALPDVLVTAPGIYGNGHGLFINSLNGAVDSFGNSCNMSVQGVLGANANSIKLSNLNLAPLDVDGDATIDLLHMPKVKTYSVYTPQGQGCDWSWVGREITTASQQNPKIDFGNDTLDVKVMDANFDGLVDVVVSTGTELQTFFALGRYAQGDTQFGHASWRTALSANLSNNPVTSCVPWSSQPVRFSDPDVKLSDMNGDGIVDIVRVRRGDVIYWPGRGNGYWGTGDRDDCAGGTFGENRHIRMADAPYYSDIQGTTLRLDDVNGDGLDDLVQVRFDAVDVWLNVNGTGWTERHIIDGTPASPSYANRVRLVDVNGSGTRDILWGNADQYRYIDLQGGHQPRLLNVVHNGLGKTTTIEYGTSTEEMLAAERADTPWETVMPTVTHVVKRVTESAGLSNAPAVVTEYSYENPLFEGRQREFRGFKRARATRVGDANSPTDVTETTFLLGECRDVTPDNGENECDPAYRNLDNPLEALKGLPVLTEKRDALGNYLSTSYTEYELRELYVGLDGRRVMHAVQSGSDTWAYDTGPFSPGLSLDLKFPVALSSFTGVEPSDNPLVPPIGALDIEQSIPIRSGQFAHTSSYAVVDAYGNQTHAVSFGCHNSPECLGTDAPIASITLPSSVSGDPTAWMRRTIESCVVGGEPVGGGGDLLWCDGLESGTALNYTTTEYNGHGQPVATFAELAGSLSLDRDEAVVNPLNVSDGYHLLSETRYNETLGWAERSRSGEGRCADLLPDPHYATAPIKDTIYTGGCTSLTAVGGGRAFNTEVVNFDRGMGQVVRATAITTQPTEAVYDEFGRLTQLWAPSNTEQLSPLPSVIVEYDLATAARPWSIIHTQTQDGRLLEDAEYLESYAFVDGFGRTITTISEADPTYDDGNWIVGGLLTYDAKSAVRRKYLPYFVTIDAPLAFSPEVLPATRYGSQRYDAFGRQVQTYDVDGTVTLQSVYHALSTDLYDAADLQPGPHQGSYASTHADGHGRTIRTTERIHVDGAMEARHVWTEYLPTGQPAKISRRRGSNTANDVVRWMRYDTLGRMVLNVEPNTTENFTSDPDAPSSTFRAWRYAYNVDGDLTGTSDARGCGVDFYYDGAGRLSGEDYVPCESWHPPYSAPNFTTGDGVEVLYLYDRMPEASAPIGVDRPAGFGLASRYYLGRLVAVLDRSSATFLDYDGRGRLTRTARRLAKPAAHIARDNATAQPPPKAPADRYTDHEYVQTLAYDSMDRTCIVNSGAQTDELTIEANGLNRSWVLTYYSKRGTPRAVHSVYGLLVWDIDRNAEGALTRILYHDGVHTATEHRYDDRRRLRNTITYRTSAGGLWDYPNTYPDAEYSPPPNATSVESHTETFQLLLQDEDYTYDVVGNPIEIRDWRIPDEWPNGAKPVTRKMKYDDLYRVTQVDYEYEGGDDDWESPFKRELAEAADSTLQKDPRRAQPSPHVSFDKRVKRQTYEYDWLGNTSETTDDAKGFYDRSLGSIQNGPTNGAAYQLRSAELTDSPRSGRVDTKYDAAGNLTRMELRRDGPCLGGTTCSQRFAYQWDEVGRLVRARRWDTDTVGDVEAPLPTGTPAADLMYSYDAGDQRILKTATDAAGEQSHTAYIFNTLELRRAPYIDTDEDGTADDYELSKWTEVPFLLANGVRLARVVWHEPENASHEAMPERADTIEPGQHVLLELGDHLGSTSVVLDLGTGELVERSTFYAYGGTESDYRPDRWAGFRSDYRFTGKEEDVEVGLTYFGFRYLSPQLGRWVSADPLAIHGLGADLNVYAYVSGYLLKSVDPVGLQEVQPPVHAPGPKPAPPPMIEPPTGPPVKAPGPSGGSVRAPPPAPRPPVRAPGIRPSLGGVLSGALRIGPAVALSLLWPSSTARDPDAVVAAANRRDAPWKYDSRYDRPKPWDAAYKQYEKNQLFRSIVYEMNRDPETGKVIGPNGEEIAWGDDWDLAHKWGVEFEKHQESAWKRGLTREEFMKEYYNPENFEVQIGPGPEGNRSKKHDAPKGVTRWPSGAHRQTPFQDACQRSGDPVSPPEQIPVAPPESDPDDFQEL